MALDQCSCVKEELNGRLYNSSSIGYPKHLPDGRIQYQIAVVSDLDHDSKFDGKKNTWRSFVRRGRLYFHPELLTAQIQWNEEESVALYSQLSSGGRAMELSDLAVFDGNLLTVDDRTEWTTTQGIFQNYHPMWIK
uniref:Uncharacterized protein n=1 Tax=Meloidogyne javanica TaxID=6303 RepID=A0A915LWU7_MELJA